MSLQSLLNRRAYNGPLNPNPADGESSVAIYGYVPSSSFAAIAATLQFLVIMNHVAYFIRGRRTRVFQGLMCMACIMEFIGYIFRVKGHYNPFLVTNFIVQYFMIVCAPVFITGGLYIALSAALLRSKTGAELLRFNPKILLAIFISADLLATITQIVGAALVGVSESAQRQGKSSDITPAQANDIILASLAFQSACFLVFIGLQIVVMHRHRTQYPGLIPKTFFGVIFVSSMLIMLRTIFRLAETAQGVFGYASSHEVLFGTLEFLPVILALTIWAVFPLYHLLAAMTEAEDLDSDDGSSVERRAAEPIGPGAHHHHGHGHHAHEGETESERMDREKDERDLEEEEREERKAEERMRHGFVI